MQGKFMRIGFFTSIENWGGSETYLLLLMQGIRKRGHTPVLFGIKGTRLWQEAAAVTIDSIAWKNLPVNLNGTPEERISIFQNSGTRSKTIKEIVLRMIPGWMKLLLGNIREVLALRALFRCYPVDVMHVGGGGYEVAGAACYLCGIPSLIMNMLTPPHEPNWFRRLLMKETLRTYDHVSSQSAASTREWIRFARLPEAGCSYVWNGVDVTRFESGERRKRMAGDVFNVVSVGRLHPMKGFPDLIDAVALVNDHRMRVVILGEGDQQSSLQRRIDGHHLGDRVTLCGHVENPELFLKGADCFCLPSVSHESCPAVVLEAMASGLPVITSDFGPLPEINIHGETGLVTPAGDAEKLAQALRRLMDDPGLCLFMGGKGKLRAQQCFSTDRMVEEMLRLYEDVKAKKKGGNHEYKSSGV